MNRTEKWQKSASGREWQRIDADLEAQVIEDLNMGDVEPMPSPSEPGAVFLAHQGGSEDSSYDQRMSQLVMDARIQSKKRYSKLSRPRRSRSKGGATRGEIISEPQSQSEPPPQPQAQSEPEQEQERLSPIYDNSFEEKSQVSICNSQVQSNSGLVKAFVVNEPPVVHAVVMNPNSARPSPARTTNPVATTAPDASLRQKRCAMNVLIVFLLIMIVVSFAFMTIFLLRSKTGKENDRNGEDPSAAGTVQVTPPPTEIPTLLPIGSEPGSGSGSGSTPEPTPSPTTTEPAEIESTASPSSSPTTQEPSQGTTAAPTMSTTRTSTPFSPTPPPTASPTMPPTISPHTESPSTIPQSTTAQPTTASPPSSSPTTMHPITFTPRSSSPTAWAPTTSNPSAAVQTRAPSAAPTQSPVVPGMGHWLPLGGPLFGNSSGDQFGSAVKVSSDGTVVVASSANEEYVQAFQQTVDSNTNDVEWSPMGPPIALDQNGRQFGASLDISDDGLVIAVGAPRHFRAGTGATGSVQFYHFSGTMWEPIGEIFGESSGEECGHSVALSGDGRVAAISSWKASSNRGADSAGHVRVFRSNGGTWTQLGSTIRGDGMPGDLFGSSIDLSRDGHTVAVGASGSNEGSGQLKAYRYDSGGDWRMIGQRIGKRRDEHFGQIVAIASGAVAGAGVVENIGLGLVRVFSLQARPISRIGDPIFAEAVFDREGWSMSLSEDGQTLATSAAYDDWAGSQYGEIRVFRFVGSDWKQLGQTLDAQSSSEEFGGPVALSGDGSIVVAGGPGIVRVFSQKN